jgi:hypothetical protein
MRAVPMPTSRSRGCWRISTRVALAMGSSSAQKHTVCGRRQRGHSARGSDGGPIGGRLSLLRGTGWFLNIGLRRRRCPQKLGAIGPHRPAATGDQQPDGEHPARLALAPLHCRQRRERALPATRGSAGIGTQRVQYRNRALEQSSPLPTQAGPAPRTHGGSITTSLDHAGAQATTTLTSAVSGAAGRVSGRALAALCPRPSSVAQLRRSLQLPLLLEVRLRASGDKPGWRQGGPTSAYAAPAHPARGFAARVAGPECTHVLEDRKRRPDAAAGPDRRPSVNRRIEVVG